MRPTAEQLLRASAEQLRTDGWCRYISRLGKRTCMSEALMDSNATLKCTQAQFNRARRALKVVVELDYLPNFNDHHCQVKEDAIAAFEIAADLVSP